jgi:hypothetical protein
MSNRVRLRQPAFKHGGYSATALLPGEDPAEFEKLHRDIIDELRPDGALEHDTVWTIARLKWRKQNLATLRSAELARGRCAQIRSEKLGNEDLALFEITEGREEAIRDAVDQARKELGSTYALVELGETATFDNLFRELEVEERLDAMIDRCLKRLLFLRGLKSISTSSTSAPQQCLSAPKKA